MGIGKEGAREWNTYRSIVKEAEGVYGSGHNKLGGVLRWQVFVADRLCAEIDGVLLYVKERIFDSQSPEEISQTSETLIRERK